MLPKPPPNRLDPRPLLPKPPPNPLLPKPPPNPELPKLDEPNPPEPKPDPKLLAPKELPKLLEPNDRLLPKNCWADAEAVITPAMKQLKRNGRYIAAASAREGVDMVPL